MSFHNRYRVRNITLVRQPICIHIKLINPRYRSISKRIRTRACACTCTVLSVQGHAMLFEFEFNAHAHAHTEPNDGNSTAHAARGRCGSGCTTMAEADASEYAYARSALLHMRLLWVSALHTHAPSGSSSYTAAGAGRHTQRTITRYVRSRPPRLVTHLVMRWSPAASRPNRPHHHRRSQRPRSCPPPPPPALVGQQPRVPAMWDETTIGHSRAPRS